MSHAYSTNLRERQHVPLYFAIAAIAAAFGVYRIVGHYGIPLPWWFSPPDTMVFYGLFYLVYDRVIWKWRWVHRVGITNIPDLGGLWRGEVMLTKTSDPSIAVGGRTAIELVIRQTWTEISIRGQTSQSASHSLSAHVLVDDDCSVNYEYANEPLAGAAPTMHAHRGMARLELIDQAKGLRGEYYSGRDRQNIGTIELRLESWGTSGTLGTKKPAKA